jgi:nitroreductase
VPPKTEIPSQQGWPAALQARMEQMRTERYTLLGIDRSDRAAIKANQGLNHHFFGAPVVVYLCLDKKLGPWPLYDLGILSQSIMLAAEHYGLGSIVALNLVAYPDLIRQELQIPEDLAIAIGIALGYPDNESKINQFRSARRPVEEIVTFKGL